MLNWDVTHFFVPRLVPRMATASGIPAEACTMVVVPTIFSSESQVNAQLEKLEVHFLANQDKHIYFAVLSDFPDADQEETSADSLLLAAAQRGIEELNRRHSPELPHRFYLFHRRRQWNPGEGKWMGWERKRGKLEEFNRLLRGAADTSFTLNPASAAAKDSIREAERAAQEALLRRVRYVITLDADTQLPRDVARKLVGAAIHPPAGPRCGAHR